MEYSGQFQSSQSNGFVTGAAAKTIMSSSGLPTAALRDIWSLSDLDKDGKLDVEEFTIAMFLIDMAKKGHPVPPQLEPAMIPPSKGGGK